MINTKFEAFKLKKLLLVNGINFNFKRRVLNDYNEFDQEKELEDIVVIKGIYHEQTVTTQIASDEGSQFRTEKTPMILCEYNEKLDLLNAKDLIFYNNHWYELQGIANLSNFNIIADIALRVVDLGGGEI